MTEDYKRVYLYEPSHDTIDIRKNSTTGYWEIISAGRGRILLTIRNEDLHSLRDALEELLK